MFAILHIFEYLSGPINGLNEKTTEKNVGRHRAGDQTDYHQLSLSGPCAQHRLSSLELISHLPRKPPEGP